MSVLPFFGVRTAWLSRSVFARKPKFGFGDYDEPWATDPPMFWRKSNGARGAQRYFKLLSLWKGPKKISVHWVQVNLWWLGGVLRPGSPHDKSPKISTNEMISSAVALLPPQTSLGLRLYTERVSALMIHLMWRVAHGYAWDVNDVLTSRMWMTPGFTGSICPCIRWMHSYLFLEASV